MKRATHSPSRTQLSGQLAPTFFANMRESQGDLAIAFGFMATQMLFGLAMGFIAIRTRSLLVPSIVHAVFDALPL